MRLLPFLRLLRLLRLLPFLQEPAAVLGQEPTVIPSRS